MYLKIGETYNINKLEGNTLEILFIPPKTGSYELVCNGNHKLEGTLLYGEELEECFCSTFVNKEYSLKLARTLLYNCTYCIRILLIKQKDAQTLITIRIDDIPEPSNSLFKYQWGLLNKKNGLDINILPLWRYIKNSNINIGIVDTVHRDKL